MNEEHNHNHNEQVQPSEQPQPKADQAYKFLSDALRASFGLLKIIIIVLLAVFLFSGFQTVGPYEKALVLTFGKISGEGEGRVLDSGLRWVWPYPIQEIVRIPVEKKINLALDQQWYYETEQEKLSGNANVRPTLNPLIDGYSLTRGESRNEEVGQTDYNIVHTKWQLTYQITDPDAFFKNAYVDFGQIEAGQNYSDVIEKSITPMLRSLLSDAVVSTLVNYTIDDVLFQQIGTITDHVKVSLQDSFDKVQAGITVVSIQLDSQVPPRQVAKAFWASVQAANIKETTIKDAQSYYGSSLNEAGGPVAEELLISFDDQNSDPQQVEKLWSQLAGEAQNVVAQAQAYRTRVVENARANAEYFNSLLPEYRKTPKLVVQKIWQDAVQDVLDEVDEKMIIQPTGNKNEIRILLNRDPAIKQKQDQNSQ
ncbi:MAG: SPFH domain-containing protein [Phycisphaerae bacterium]|jgi:membrane protease subunit HflK